VLASGDAHERVLTCCGAHVQAVHVVARAFGAQVVNAAQEEAQQVGFLQANDARGGSRTQRALLQLSPARTHGTYTRRRARCAQPAAAWQQTTSFSC
jgi:hypothetical protein